MKTRRRKRAEASRRGQWELFGIDPFCTIYISCPRWWIKEIVRGPTRARLVFKPMIHKGGKP